MADHCNPHHHHHLLKKRPSWVCTLATQAALCLALYAVLSIGRPQKLDGIHGRDPFDLYFLSVRGGLWPPKQQTQLLLQMAKAVKIYNAKFVVNISDLGEDDPLTQNATKHFPFSKIPWYTTTALRGRRKENFLRKIKIPYGQVLDIIEMDTGLLRLNGTDSDQLLWLDKALSMSNSDWHIVIGFDSLISCKENAKDSVKFYEPFRDILINHGVNAYVSQQSCNGLYFLDEGIAFLGNPGPSKQEHTSASVAGNRKDNSGLTDGFLLHRVSPLEIESYFFKSTGKVVFRSVIHQRGREIM